MATGKTGKGKSKASKARASQEGIIEINLDEVEDSLTYDGDDPTRGFYTFRLVSVASHESQSGNAGIRWMFSLTDNPLYEGWTRSVYSNLESTKWKTEEIMLALAGGKKVKGTKKAKVRLNLNIDKELAKYVAAAELVRGRVQKRKDSDPDDPEMELGKIIALDPEKQAARKAAEAEADDDFEDADEFEDADDDEADEDEDETDEDDEDDDEETDDEDDEEDEDEEDDDDDEEEDEEDEPEPEPVKPAKKSKAKAEKPAAKASSKKAEPAKATKGKKTKK